MTTNRRVLVVGAGWSGAVVARQFHDAGVPIEILERSAVVGGHARTETLNGVVYEPNGAHIFHTSDPEVAAFVDRFGIRRPYEHRVLTEIDLGDDGMRMMSWPLQIDELEKLPDWSLIERELADLPTEPSGADLETYVVSMMGRRLYELFIEGYTRKQWGCEPSDLSSSFAPRRIELRRDGNRRLFRDRWEFFESAGFNSAIERVLSPVSVTCGADVTVADLEGERLAAVVLTGGTDRFLGRPGELAWRGVGLRSTYSPTDTPTGTQTAAYVINRPSLTVPYTRTVETKHASGQQICGTVVSEEYPGAPACHYPVPTVDRRYEKLNLALQAEIVERLSPTPVYFCGRLATYSYIDQDQAIARALECARRVLVSFR